MRHLPVVTRCLLMVASIAAVVLAPSNIASAAPRAQEEPADIDAPLTSAFTYQGRLDVVGTPVNAACAMQFDLWSAASGGTQVGATQNLASVTIAAGLFNVTLNQANEFGASPFNGEARFLEMAVQCPGDAAFVTLPRQQLTATPYALTSLSTEALQGRPVSAAAPTAGNVLTWNGSQWQGSALPSNVDWRLAGNSNASAASLLGTTNQVTLTMVTSDVVGLRIVAATPSTTNQNVVPNFLGGDANNHVVANVQGAVIGGGGAQTVSSSANRIFDSFGTIGGGTGNVAGDDNGNHTLDTHASVGGGFNNRAWAVGSAIAGGVQNTVDGRAAAIGGGQYNVILDDASYGVIPGGLGAVAYQYGQLAHAGGYFEYPGDAQHSLYILRNVTNGAAAQRLYLDCHVGTNGSIDTGVPCASGKSIALAVDRAMNVEIAISAVVVSSADPATYPVGSPYGYRREMLARNSGGGGFAFWNFGPEVEVGNMTAAITVNSIFGDDELRFQVSGPAGVVLRWIAVVEAVELALDPVAAAGIEPNANMTPEDMDQ